jgi:hypothetical protein
MKDIANDTDLLSMYNMDIAVWAIAMANTCMFKIKKGDERGIVLSDGICGCYLEKQ